MVKRRERKGYKKGEWVFLGVAREKEFVPRWIRGQFTSAADREKVGEAAG